MLALHFSSTFVVAIDYFEEASFIVDGHVFEHYSLTTALVLAGYASERA